MPTIDPQSGRTVRRARRPAALLAVALALPLALASCRSKKPAAVEELFSTRMLALSYLQRNQLPEAEAQFQKLIAMAPDDPLGYTDLGLSYLQAGKYAEAEAQLRRARELDPSSTQVRLMLAKLYALTGRRPQAVATLEQLRAGAPRDPHVRYALARIESQNGDTASLRRYDARLKEVLDVAPANLAVRLELIDVLLRRGKLDSAVSQLEEVRRIPPQPPHEAAVALDSTIQLLRANQPAPARARFDRFRDLMQVTVPYQAALEAVKWTDGPIVGRPVLTFTPKYLITLRGLRERATPGAAHFVDVTDDAGLFPPATQAAPGATAAAQPAAAPTGSASSVVRAGVQPVSALAVGDVDGDGTDDLFVSFWNAGQGSSVARLYRVQGGFVHDITESSGLRLPAGAAFATFADYDNDGWLDLFVIDARGAGHLFRNRGNGTFQEVTAQAGVGNVKGARQAVFVDLDHDGDLDLLLVGSGPRTVYRNNLDGTFTDATASYGLAGGSDEHDALFADFDDDGRIDLFIASASGSGTLLHNGGAMRFSNATAASGLSANGGSGGGAAAVGDYDNDGRLDLFVGGAAGGAPTLWRNVGGSFTPDRRSEAALAGLRSLAVMAARFVDYDNDGWLDLVVAGTPAGGTGTAGLYLFHNEGDGRFVDRSTLLPPALRTRGGTALAVTDVDDDGDQDLLMTDAAGAPHLLRNDGGNANLAVDVRLEGLRTGSGKNNDFGIGARVELRSGEIYQTRVASSRITHFGLGPHLKADVLRIEWPNGVPQTVYFPGTDQSVLESELLKGSCAFAYTWDGHRFRFVTDVMWRSALGMPLGLMGSASAFAPAGASQEYLRIPGEALQPRDGRYLLQLTEELWETAYADQVKLLAVDHPDSVDVFVDEHFVPPGPVQLRLFQVARPHPPRSAVDDRGLDVLPALRASDDVYVSNLVPAQYQGVVQPHDLILDLGSDAGRTGSYLFLRGWIYPTDASINVALAQQSKVKVAPPSLEVRDARGHWVTAIPDIGFPSGKDKTIVVSVAGRFPTSDHHVRIRTNMQIYWDQAFVSDDAARSPVKITTLSPVSADLHRRGFSRMYRKGGRYGPYWFAYDDVTSASPWRPITGAFTRFGDVLPLLENPDDMYVIMGPGDEATLQFDASSATALPPGWKRDFLLYTDGWIKDSDLNTAFGTTVEPLPFHAMKAYPYAPGEAYPADPAHQRYLRTYDTRLVGRNMSQR